jgi:hypothetical protein
MRRMIDRALLASLAWRLRRDRPAGGFADRVMGLLADELSRRNSALVSRCAALDLRDGLRALERLPTDWIPRQ